MRCRNSGAAGGRASEDSLATPGDVSNLGPARTATVTEEVGAPSSCGEGGFKEGQIERVERGWVSTRRGRTKICNHQSHTWPLLRPAHCKGSIPSPPAKTLDYRVRTAAATGMESAFWVVKARRAEAAEEDRVAVRRAARAGAAVRESDMADGDGESRCEWEREATR